MKDYVANFSQLGLERSHSRTPPMDDLTPLFQISLKGRASLCLTMFPGHDAIIYSVYFIAQKINLRLLKDCCY